MGRKQPLPRERPRPPTAGPTRSATTGRSSSTGSPAGYGDYNSPLHAEYPMIRWLEANGYNVSYSTDIDTDRRGGRDCWSTRCSCPSATTSTGRGNSGRTSKRPGTPASTSPSSAATRSYWKVRWENSIDASGTPYRTLVCYKESKDGARTDPLDISQNVWTGTWRDDRFSPPADGGRPENALTGTIYMTDRTSTDLGHQHAGARRRTGSCGSGGTRASPPWPSARSPPWASSSSATRRTRTWTTGSGRPA